MLWCSHCPPDKAQFPILNEDPQMTMTVHIISVHPNTGAWVQGDDWDIITADERGALAQHTENITA
jgi:hypothetical protein